MPAPEVRMLLVSLALAVEPSLHDSLLARLDAVAAGGADAGCLTGLSLELKDNWESFTQEERARITGVLTPWKADLLDRAPSSPPAPPDAIPTDTCFGQRKENRISSDHFSVEWDDGAGSRSNAEGFLEALEVSYEAEVNQYGWKKPLGDGAYLMATYIEEGDYQGAYTSVDYCGNGYVPYIVAYEGAFSSGSWSDSMASHEFNHALQFGYGFAHEFWWWEATATYIEHLVWPDVDWWSSYVGGYTDNPHIAIAASSQQDQDVFWHMYGMAIWGFYIDNYQGGPDAVRATWEASERERGEYTLSAEETLEELGIDFRAAYIDFIGRNAVMDYDDHRAFPQIRMDSVDALPAAGESERRTRPQGYGQNYLRFDAGFGDGDLRVRFTGDPDVAWAVVLAEVSRTEVLRSEYVVVEAGAGEVTLPAAGAEDVVLIVSPLDARESDHDYAWEAEMVAAEVVAETGAGDEKAAIGGCACGVTPRGTGLGWSVGLLALTGLRRRRA